MWRPLIGASPTGIQSYTSSELSASQGKEGDSTLDICHCNDVGSGLAIGVDFLGLAHSLAKSCKLGCLQRLEDVKRRLAVIQAVSLHFSMTDQVDYSSSTVGMNVVLPNLSRVGRAAPPLRLSPMTSNR